ncbi:TAXI family TRAP transporter solute-binding subunit [Virgibacillus sp. W0181]|uniref:TAXI family TRAP transporter solute-binding subunit n=1 Tax=Virgibacillus sp. W0181 TaxID=3391581 RepID=UPI003F46030B
MKKICKSIIVLFIVLFLAACGGDDTSSEEINANTDQDNGTEEESGDEEESENVVTEPVTLTWATGSDGGGWYSSAGGIASIINEKNPNINIKVIPGGTLQNIPFVTNGEADIAWEQAPFLETAMQGVEPFEEVHDNLVAIGTGFSPVYFHFAVGADSGIDSIDQIFEEQMPVKISVTPVNNSDEMLLRKFLEFYDVTYDDIKSWGGDIYHGSYTEQSSQFQDNNVDAMFIELGLPGAAITEAANSRDMKLLPIPKDVIEHLAEYSVIEGTIPAGTYPKAVNGDEDIESAILETMLVASKDVPEDVIYEITKIINENTDRFESIHASLAEYETENAIETITMDLHPGAEKYYKEIGLMD